MPKNRFIYLGILVVAASALLYAGLWLSKLVENILPWTMGVGVLLIVAGVFMEANKAKAAKLIGHDLKPGATSAENIKETTL